MWDFALKKIYGDTPASITIVSGPWKTGKTNTALHIAVDELKNRLRLIKHVGSNIQCFEDDECTIPSNKDSEYIDNFDMLNVFLRRGGKKAFIYDEALKNSPSKRAMTALNAGWSKIIPELSKGGDKSNPGGCHLFVITQEDSLTEKTFQHPTFKTASFEKIDLPKSNPQHLKVVKLKSKLLRETIVFKDLPAAQVNYNPYLAASWSLSPTGLSVSNLSKEFKVALKYAEGKSSNQILDEMKGEVTDRMDVTRSIRKVLKLTLKDYMLNQSAADSAAQNLTTLEA